MIDVMCPLDPGAACQPAKDLPKLADRCCGNCKWFAYDGDVTQHAAPRFPKNAGGNCVWPEPATSLPVAITRYHQYRVYSRSYMGVTDTGCPTWEAGENAIVPKEQPQA